MPRRSPLQFGSLQFNNHFELCRCQHLVNTENATISRATNCMSRFFASLTALCQSLRFSSVASSPSGAIFMLEATKLLGVNCIARRARSKAGCNDGKKVFLCSYERQTVFAGRIAFFLSLIMMMI